MAQLCQIDIDQRIAELYLKDSAWQIKLVTDHPLMYHVIGSNYMKAFKDLSALLEAPELPHGVKWAARGLPGIPLDLEEIGLVG